jgi:glycolate oxidase iron-sulfur subunit
MLGCAERSLFPAVSRAVLRLLPDAVDVPAGQGCCGALHAHNGASERAGDLARELGEVLPGTIVTTAGGCAAHLAHHLGDQRVRELSQYLVHRWSGPDAGGAPALGMVRVPGSPGDRVARVARVARVGLQDSCHLRNGLGETRSPRDLLRRVAEYVELPAAGTCCGSAGTYSLLRPKDSRAVLAQHLREIEEARLDFVVVLNPVCQRQLINGLRRAGSRTRVLHLAELLLRALPPAETGN